MTFNFVYCLIRIFDWLYVQLYIDGFSKNSGFGIGSIGCTLDYLQKRKSFDV